ncbi:MAG: hypothetical protein Q9166_005496 [cf. Caloplaca sp. 2 TL-2023]
MEDSDSSLTRKRPRLDSGSRSYRSMSADRFVPSPSPKELNTARTTPPLDTVSVKPASSEYVNPALEGTPSKMTINVRDPGPQPSPLAPAASTGDRHTYHDNDRDELASSSEPESSKKLRSPSPNRVSQPSSPSRSPEIEVAEVEDISQEPGHTKWRTLRSAPDPVKTRDDLWAIFPYRNQTQNLWESADELARHFLHQPSEDRALFRELADWIRRYMDVTKPSTSRGPDMYDEESSFWIHFVGVINALCKRSRGTAVLPLPLRQNYSSEDRESFEDLLASFAALTFRMVEIDCHTLENVPIDDNAKQELVSFGYLEWLASILSSNEGQSSLWKHLRHMCDYDSSTAISAIAEAICQPSFNGMALLSQLMQHILTRARSIPDVIDKVGTGCNIVIRVVDYHQALRLRASEAENDASSSRQMSLSAAYDFFQDMDAILQTFISKQVAALSHDICYTMIRHLSVLLRRITTASEDLTTRVLREKLGLVEESSTAAACVIAEEAWKFQLFRKCFLEGRMEIRIQGLESMQRELLDIHRSFIQSVHITQWNPVVAFLSNFIVENKLVDYLVGVESHPRLIRLTGNIVGFLVVTNRYTEAESDRIWDTVQKSQDPGVVGAVLQMLPNIFNISDYKLLLYLVAKLNEVPLSSWDIRMNTYAESLFVHTIDKWKDLKRGFGMDVSPYHCCIRLIQEASAYGSSAFHKRRNTSTFANRMLNILLDVGPSDPDRLRIYEDCIGHISGRTAFATGSICVINIFLRHDSRMNIATLAKEFEMTSLIIDGFEQMAAQMSQGLQDRRFFDESLGARLDLVQNMIISSPDSITTEGGWRLWEAMVGSEAPSDMARDAALVMLVNATMTLRKRNPFVDACISEYLPKLAPRFFTKNIFYFVNQIIQYGTLLEQTDQHVEGSQSDRLGIDMLWRIALVAPSNTVEHKAIETLVVTYLDSPKTQSAPKVAIERMHVEVVDRCVRQLTTAASRLKSFTDGTSSGEDEPMVIVASDEEIQLQRLSFSRSLLILKELFNRIRSHPSYSPVPSAHAQLHNDVEEIRGIPITVRYQPFSGGSNRPIKCLQVGDLETVQDLTQRFSALTGFANLTVIVGGQKLNLEECSDSTLRDTRFHDKGLFLIKKIHGSDDMPDLTQARVLKPLEKEVMGYFPEFYKFLSLDETLSVDVLEFLKTFPPDDKVISLVNSRMTSIDDVFPSGTPFKALYSIFTYEQCLEISLQNGCPSQEFICHSIQMMAESLTSTTGTGASFITNGDHQAVAGLVECLLKFLKGEWQVVTDETGSNSMSISEAARTNSTKKILSDKVSLVERLFSSINAANDTKELRMALALTCGSLGCILEASLHSETFFENFKNAGQFRMILQKALLHDRRRAIRLGIAKSIRSICDHPNLESSKKYQFASYCWENLQLLIPETLQYGRYSEDFYGVTTTILRSLEDSHRQNLNLTAYVQHWTSLLLKHNHNEFVGRDNLDWVIYGISDLIQWCIQYIKSTKKPVKISGNLMESLLRAHLFPIISEPTGQVSISTATPVLHSKTRANLYSIIFALCNDVGEYHKLLKLIRSLMPQGEGPQAWSWGIAQTTEDHSYDTNWNFERSNAMRSPTGYPGLRNLTNTCYMNSLLTQLFMNVHFRGFMLDTDIVDRHHTQRLLAETRTLFGFMQGTALKAVDTQGIADSLVNYENTLIDVSVQMDVDEFYNLLFDRWESQILSVPGKKSFRAFYGGQLVQQIKSKECPHVSEREEPFSAIQVDIQGKLSLSDSMSAYVKGEIMEGENKYSCTSCGTYVDAVKRACLKDIPDNLIFHLKRFDYDIMTGMRHKINDRFDFSERIDMAPYNIDYLQDTEQPLSPDIFELVGILVHAGTAESGHYYSFIKERPSKPEQGTSWVEFNDADVTPFDPSQIPDLCFGGVTEPTGYAGASYSKTWNAYMLFYQRVRATDDDFQQEQQLAVGLPIHKTLASDLSDQITIDNKNFLRKICLYDSTHARFAVSLLDRLRSITNSCCSDDHMVERDAILFALEYADQVLSRMKDATDFERLLESLATIIRGCSTCCKVALEWMVNSRNAFRNLVLRCPTARVRRSFTDMLVRALLYLRENDPQEYGFDVDSLELKSGNEVLPETSCGIFQRLVYNIRELWPILHVHPRAWDDYFGLLSTVAEFGVPEVFVLLREDFLRLCLEILIVDSSGAKRLRVENPHYSQFVRLIEKGRRFSLANLIGLLQILLLKIDLEGRSFDPKYQDRLQLDGGKFPLSNIEESYLYYGTDSVRSRPLVFLDKIITAKSNPSAVKRILQALILAGLPAGHLSDISKTILNGINIDPADLAEPHLAAALVFCETSASTPAVRDMIKQIAREVDTIGTSGGHAHLTFFVQARHIVNARLPQRWFNNMVLKTVPEWGPPLLMYYEESVRAQTVEFLKDLIFNYDTQSTDNGDENGALEEYARALCEACIKRVHENVVQQQSQVDVRSVELIVDVIKHCVKTYFGAGTAEDDRVAEEAEGASPTH